jgi:hypothetical protein
MDDIKITFFMIDPKYQPCFIHDGAFSKNLNINPWNVGLYRRLQILRRRGLFGHDNGLVGKVDHRMKKSGNFLTDFCFGHIDRSKYWSGWGKGD